MTYPNFFKNVPTLTLQDPLAQTLGTFEKGMVTFEYLDVVKSAGHSCPTVGGAYLMTHHALKALYNDVTPTRGNISVSFKEDVSEGVAGVIANVITQLTGAADIKGFKGLNGKFARHSLLHFNADIKASARFTRVDTNESVDVVYNPNVVKPSASMMPLMQKMLQGEASPEEIAQFGSLWQARVEAILIDNFNNAELIKITKV